MMNYVGQAIPAASWLHDRETSTILPGCSNLAVELASGCFFPAQSQFSKVNLDFPVAKQLKIVTGGRR